jgi:hypothetical protein
MLKQSLQGAFGILLCDAGAKAIEVGLQFGGSARQEIAIRQHRQILKEFDQKGGPHGWHPPGVESGSWDSFLRSRCIGHILQRASVSQSLRSHHAIRQRVNLQQFARIIQLIRHPKRRIVAIIAT